MIISTTELKKRLYSSNMGYIVFYLDRITKRLRPRFSKPLVLVRSRIKDTDPC